MERTVRRKRNETTAIAGQDNYEKKNIAERCLSILFKIRFNRGSIFLFLVLLYLL